MLKSRRKLVLFDLLTIIDNFLVYKRFRVWSKTIVGIEVLHAFHHHLKFMRPHVLRSINPESSDTQINQPIKHLNYLLSDIRLRMVQVMKSHQLTVADFHRIIPVVDGACGLVEVVGVEGDGRVAHGVGISFGASSAHRGLRVPGAVVDDDIDEDTNADSVASATHLLEFLLVA